MPKHSTEIIQIDVKKIIRNQDNKTLKKLPGFVIKFIKWLIMEKEMNRILRAYGHLKNYEFCEAVIEDLNIKVEIYGKENLPDDPQIILAGNHALGGVDFFAITEAVKEKYPNGINHLTNEILMKITPLIDLMVPVNVFGKNPEEYKKLYDERLQDPKRPITIFPSGEVSRYNKGKWDDGLWRSGFIRFAKKFNRPVIPFFIPTKNSPWFYRVAKWRKFLGIKANLELFLLPRQIFYQRDKTLKIIIGKPISPDTFDESKTVHEWAEFVKQKAYELQEKK